MWDVTIDSGISSLERKFLLTHPVWDVTATGRITEEQYNISTHTSRVGCDMLQIMWMWNEGFLLTHPVWDVTW